jgi:hypothetical protein
MYEHIDAWNINKTDFEMLWSDGFKQEFYIKLAQAVHNSLHATFLFTQQRIYTPYPTAILQ